MEDLVKVVVFEVDIPDVEDLQDCKIYSKPFTIEVNGVKTTWKLRCNLNYKNESFVGIFLISTSKLLEPLNVCSSFHLISSNKSTEISFKSWSSQFLTSAISSWGPFKFVSHKHLFDNSKDLFITGRKIRIVTKIFCIGGILPTNRISTSSKCLKNLYESMNDSDLIIKSFDHIGFKAHKNIICARSEVLSQMLKSQMNESVTGILTLDDRSEVVKKLLRFIYCGDYAEEFEDIKDVDIDLYYAAQRYELEDLKPFCLKSIFKRLEVWNSLEIAEFAKMFNLKKLYSCCLLMIYANFTVISKSDEWKLLEDKTEIFNDIMQKSHKLMNNEMWTSDDF